MSSDAFPEYFSNNKSHATAFRNVTLSAFRGFLGSIYGENLNAKRILLAEHSGYETLKFKKRTL